VRAAGLFNDLRDIATFVRSHPRARSPLLPSASTTLPKTCVVRAAGLFNDLRDIATFVRIASTSEISAPAVGEHHLADFYRELASEAAGSPIR
jgi:hypothetical protein